MPKGNVFFTACVGAFGSSLMSWQSDSRRNASTRSIIEPVEMGDWTNLVRAGVVQPSFLLRASAPLCVLWAYVCFFTWQEP